MEQTEQPVKKKNKLLPVILIIIVVASATFGISKYVYALHHEDTDDAQIDADINPVIVRVAGYVNEIRFEDNQKVKKGDTLVKLDDRDLQIKLQQAQATADNARAGIVVAHANVESAGANVAAASANAETAKVRVWKATQDFNRYQNLIKDNAITQQQFDAAKAEKETAESALQAANKQIQSFVMLQNAAQQQVAASESQLAQKQAEVDFAKLQLSYASIIAPATGTASKKNIQTGQLVNPSYPVCSIISDGNVYVIANFKETQLNKMHEGLPVEVKVDAFPSEKIEGTVYRLSAATGAKFSLLPPDNATGNFVKVVQRVPVKIKLNADEKIMAQLKPGMSVKVAVKLD